MSVIDFDCTHIVYVLCFLQAVAVPYSLVQRTASIGQFAQRRAMMKVHCVEEIVCSPSRPPPELLPVILNFIISYIILYSHFDRIQQRHVGQRYFMRPPFDGNLERHFQRWLVETRERFSSVRRFELRHGQPSEKNETTISVHDQ